MNARQAQEFRQRKVLRDHGWNVPQTDYIAWNSGSETVEHFLAKAMVGHALKQDGFRVASEVEGPGGEIDVLAYGTDDEPVAVECETGLTDDVTSQKIGQYVRGTPIRDCLFVEVEDLPETIPDAYAFIRGEL